MGVFWFVEHLLIISIYFPWLTSKNIFLLIVSLTILGFRSHTWFFLMQHALKVLQIELGFWLHPVQPYCLQSIPLLIPTVWLQQLCTDITECNIVNNSVANPQEGIESYLLSPSCSSNMSKKSSKTSYFCH